MFGIALTVSACLRAGTRADVAWLVEAHGLPVDDWSDAMVLTPGGGRIGSIAGGVIDGQLLDRAGLWDRGRLLELHVGETDALIAGLPSVGSARCMLVPADTLPPELWGLARAREPICLLCEMAADEVVDVDVYSTHNVAAAGDAAQRALASGVSGSTIIDNIIISVFRAVPQLVIVGETPVGDALAALANLIGWRPRIATDAGSATGLIAGLSRLDKLVVVAHDLDLAGAALIAALDSEVGYIGALGARRMQENRADWLAYRGVTELGRIRGPAGLDIGADTPAEIAVSILAQAISEGSLDRAGDGQWAVEQAPSAG